VLLPVARFDTLTDREQQMAICHELAHVKRADLWLGCVPALAERLFFFHPLVRLAAREYALSREAACDSAVMDTLEVAPQDYGRLLLALGVSRPRTGLTAAGAAWSFPNLKRRIAMLQNPSEQSTRSRALAVAVIALAVAAIVPMQLAARRAHELTPVQAAVKPKPPAASKAQPRERVESESTAQGERRPSNVGAEKKTGELNFVLLLEDDQQTTSGSIADVARARKHQKNGEPLLWFRADGQEYVVRDRDLIAQARAFWNDVYDSSFDHGEIAAAAQALGAEALAHGLKAAEQGIKGAHLGGLMADQAIRALTDARLLTDAHLDAHLLIPDIDITAALESTREQLEQSLPDLEETLRELEQRLKSDVDEQLRDLRQELRALEESKRKKEAGLSRDFERRVNEFGARVGESARQANEKMRALVERARSSGLAVTVR
jgi:hypothetical protein